MLIATIIINGSGMSSSRSNRSSSSIISSTGAVKKAA